MEPGLTILYSVSKKTGVFFETLNSRLESLKNQASHLREGLFVLLVGEEKYLIHNVTPCAVIDVRSTTRSLWTFQPVLTEFPQKMNKATFGSPVFKTIKEANIQSEGLTGLELATESELHLIQNTNEMNQEHFKSYKRQMETSDKVVRGLYDQHRLMDISDEIEQFLYNEAWNN